MIVNIGRVRATLDGARILRAAPTGAVSALVATRLARPGRPGEAPGFYLTDAGLEVANRPGFGVEMARRSDRQGYLYR